MKTIQSGFESHIIDTRSSKGIAVDLNGFDISNNADTRQLEDLKIFLEMARNDSIISSAFDATVDVFSYAGWDFVPKNSKKKNKALELKAKFETEYYFSDLLDNLCYSMLHWGDAFLEIRKIGYRYELYSLESPEIVIVHDTHGKIQSFRQDGTKATWTADEVIHIPLKVMGSRVYSLKPLEPIANEYTANILARGHLKDIFKNAPPKVIYTLLNASKEQRLTFINNLRLAKTNPAIDVVVTGEMKNEVLGVQVYKDLLAVLDFLRAQILAVTRVPPLWLGFIGQGADRGNAEAQIFGFETRIRKLQRKIETKINSELLPRMGVKDVFFKFNPFSLKDEKVILMNAELMVNLGIKKEKIAEYLSTRGITVDPDDMEEMEAMNDNDLDPSRVRKDRSVDDITSNINTKGTSDEGGRKLETRSIEEEFVDQYEEYLKAKKNAA